MIPPVQSPPVVVQKKSGLGCWGCGCIVLALLVFLFVALVGGSLWFAYSAGRTLTSASAVALTTTDGGDAMYQAAKQKIDDFQKQQAQRQPGSLHLSADELNTLIARDPQYAPIKDHVLVSIQNDQARVQASIPLGQFEKWVYSDRYLNGDTTFTLHLDPNTKDLNIIFSQIQLGDTPFKSDFLDGFNRSFSQSFNQRIKQNAGINDFLNQTTKFDVENNELVIETQ